jgi:MFS family permease
MTARGAGYLDLIRSNRSFRRLWYGQVVSLLGDWFSLIASATLIARLTGSGLAVGGLFVVRMLPAFFVSPIAGVVADRYNRKYLLIATDLVRAVTVLGFLLVREPSQVWLLYTLTAVQLAMGGFFFPARNALLPSIVTGRELGAANALSASTWSVMLALGAAAGGAVAGRWGVYTAFVVDAVTYLVSAVVLTGVRYRHERSEGGDQSLGAAFGEYLAGLRYLAEHRAMLYAALLKAAIALFAGGALQVIQVAVALERFAIGESGSTALGLMYAMSGAGTGVGPIIARRLTGDDPRRMRIAISVAYLLIAVGLAVVAPLAAFWMVLLGIFLRGLGGGVNWVFSTQLLLQGVPDEVRGRVFSTDFAVFTLAVATSTAIGGWVMDHAGIGHSGLIWCLAVLILIPGGLWTAWWTRRDQASVSHRPLE